VTPAARHRLALILLWVTPALWSSNYLIARVADGRIAPHQLALGRWTLACALLLPWVGRTLWQQRAVLRAEAGRTLVLGALGMWICGAIVYMGGQGTTPVNIALIYAASPVAIALLDTRLSGQRMALAQRVGLICALAGVLLVISKGQPLSLLSVRPNPGDGWIALAAVSWTAYSLLLARWRSALAPLPRLAAIAAGGVVVLLPFTLLEAVLTPTPALGPQAWGLIVLAALLPGVFSYGAYALMMRELGPARSALVLYLAPLYGALLSWLLLGQPPQAYHAAGAALILPAIWLATRKPAPPAIGRPATDTPR
jgi:drug/metabolite transporter (DMT)-like permease